MSDETPHPRRSRAAAPRPVLLAALLVVAAACAGDGTSAPPPSPSSPPSPSQSPSDPASPTQTPDPQPPDPAEVEANELGDVPVLMYHRLAKNPTSVYERTPKQFRAELERLAREDYVPVTARAYVNGDIDIPAGTHPVVLTFDDSTRDQFSFEPASGGPAEVAPEAAVGTLRSVAREYPDFRPVATLFINREPFALPDRTGQALTWLGSHGVEIGNHTYEHANLGELSDTGVQRQLVKLQRMVTSASPETEITTMALPLGVRPDQRGLAAHGSWDGTTYDYDGVFLVGARPAPSPHAADFDPLGIPRVRSQSARGRGAKFGSARWLDHLAEHPGQRYTSDGDPTRVSFPENMRDELADDVGGAARPY